MKKIDEMKENIVRSTIVFGKFKIPFSIHQQSKGVGYNQK